MKKESMKESVRISLPEGLRQAYFWSPAWRQYEDAATEDIEHGRVHTFGDVDAAIRFLHGERIEPVTIWCHCGWPHAIRFGCDSYKDLLEEEEQEEWEVYIIEEWRATRRLWDRIKTALRVLWKGDAHTASVGLNLSDVEKVKEWAENILSGSFERTSGTP